MNINAIITIVSAKVMVFVEACNEIRVISEETTLYLM